MIRKLFRSALVERFTLSVREEGWQTALGKARVYAGMRMRNVAPTTLMRMGRGPVNRDHLYLNRLWQDLAQADAFHVTTAPHLQRDKRRIAIIGDLNLPQCRKYRVEQLAELWQSQGVETIYAHYQDIPRCISALQDATHVVLYRLQNMPIVSMYLYEARRLKLPVLYDIDDPLFSVSAYETYENMKAVEPELKQHFISEAPKYLDVMNTADIVSVSTPELAEHAAQYCPRQIYVRRNFADTATIAAGARAIASAPDKDGTGPFRVAFASGSRGHEVDFEQIAEPVAAFLEDGDDRVLTIIGHFDKTRLPESMRDRVEMHPFTNYDDYLDALARADCAVMPLTDDAFNRGKSAVRVIDAASVALPSVVGTVSDMANMVRNGETGIVAQTPEGWLAALKQLAGDRAATLAMGQAARADLEARWTGSLEPHIISPELVAWVTR